MDVEKLDHIASAISGLATVLAIIAGGLWAWVHFVRRRDLSPKVDLTVGVEFLGPHPNAAEQLLVQVSADLANLGSVRHEISEITYSLRVLGPEDKFAEDPALLGQIVFPTKIVDDRRFFPEDWKSSFVDPGVKNTYRSVTAIPRATRYVLATAWFAYKNQDGFHKSERVFTVPEVCDRNRSVEPTSTARVTS